MRGRDDSCDILGETAGFDIAGIRIRTARRRRLAPVDEEMSFEQRYVAIQPNLDESAWTLSGRLPGYAGRTVVAALEAKADSFPYGPTVNPSRTTRNADALWAISHDSITGDNGAAIDSHGPIVSVFVDATEAAATNAETGVTVEGGPQVGPNTLQAILCDGVVEVTARTSDGDTARRRTTHQSHPADDSAGSSCIVTAGSAPSRAASPATASRCITPPPGLRADAPTPRTCQPSAGSTTMS